MNTISVSVNIVGCRESTLRLDLDCLEVGEEVLKIMNDFVSFVIGEEDDLHIGMGEIELAMEKGRCYFYANSAVLVDIYSGK